jgi:hypothetical protein
MSTSIQVSRLLRLAVETGFASGFNTLLSAACTDFDIADLAYQINFAEDDAEPANFYRGDWTLDGLIARREPDLPALAIWTGEGGSYGPGQREMPRTFSGFVFVHWRFFLFVQGSRRAGLTDLREATESAMVAMLATDFSGVTYRGDLAWHAVPEQTWLDQDQQAVGFVQEVEYQASFEVNV